MPQNKEKIYPAPSQQSIKPSKKDLFAIHPCAESTGHFKRCWIKLGNRKKKIILFFKIKKASQFKRARRGKSRAVKMMFFEFVA